MFCNFYLGGYAEFDELKVAVVRLTKDVEIIESDDKLTVYSNGFTIFIKEGGAGARFASEDYGIELKFSCYIDIIASYSNWAYELMVFIGKLLNDMDGDCILELNDKPILLRKNNVTTVDDTKLSGSSKFPFHGLGVAYQIGELF